MPEVGQFVWLCVQVYGYLRGKFCNSVCGFWCWWGKCSVKLSYCTINI